MGGREFLKRSFDRPSKTRYLMKDKEGVASVVGTIMALLIFLTFMSIFVSTYIPIWMKDNERSHMNTVLSEYGDLKGKVDNLVAYTSTIQMYQSMVTGSIISTQSTKMYQSFDLGAQGVPIFASQTGGLLTFEPKNMTDTGMRIEFKEVGRTTNTTFPTDPNEKSGGKLSFYGPNRYYVEQWIAYENGGIVIKQAEGQTFRAAPTISLDWNKGGFINMTVTQIDMIGVNQSIYGLGNVGVNMNVEAVDLPTNYYVDHNARDMYINLTSEYGIAYYEYFNASCAAEGLVQITGSHVGTRLANETISYGASATGTPLVQIVKHKLAGEHYVITLHLYSAFKITYNLATMGVELVK
jgi:hypothetical protein